jgi:hypothetical protein
LVSSANGFLVQFGIQQQQQQLNNNNKIIASKLKSLGTSSTTNLKKINSSSSVNNLNDHIYKQNLNKINQIADNKQKLQLGNNKLKKGKSFLQDRNQKLANDDNVRFKSNNNNQNIYKTINSTNLNKFINNHNNNNSNNNNNDTNETRLNSNNNISNNPNLNPLKRKRFNNNDNILTCSINLNDRSFDGENNQVTSTSPSLDITELNKRLCQKFNIDVNDLNLCSNYEEQLKMNDITENLDAILSETFNKLSTSSEKDGYWCFKRKEGCKYLAAQNSGSIFKNDPFDAYENTKSNDSNIYDCTANDVTNIKKVNGNKQYSFLNSVSLKNRLKNLQYYYYGYAITKRNRHLGLVRRRIGRGGRILFEKYNHHYNLFKNNKETNKNSQNDINDSLNKFKTFYPKDCFILNSPDNQNNKNEALILPSTSSPNSIAVVPVRDKCKKKLILKKLKKTADKEFCFSSEDKKSHSNNSSSEEDEDEIENSKSTNDKLVYDYRLFPLYQLNRMENNNKELKNKDSSIFNENDNLSCLNKNEDNHENFLNKMQINDSQFGFNYQDDSNNDIGTNFIKLDLTSSNNLNSEYYFKSNKYNINMPNIKFAIKTLCVPKIVTDNGIKKKFNEKINNENNKNYQNNLQNSIDAKHERENINIKSLSENFCKITNENEKKNEHIELKDSITKPLFNGINNSISVLQAALLARKQFSNNSNANVQLNDNNNNNNNSAKKYLYDSNIKLNNTNLTSTSSVPSSSSSFSSQIVTKFINTGTDNSSLPINGINGIGATIFKSIPFDIFDYINFLFYLII